MTGGEVVEEHGKPWKCHSGWLASWLSFVPATSQTQRRSANHSTAKFSTNELQMCACAHIHIHTHTCMHVHVHTHTHTHMHACARIHIHTCMHVHVHTHTHTHACMCTHVRPHTHTHTQSKAMKTMFKFSHDIHNFWSPVYQKIYTAFYVMLK
jgi:hypothetical protein